MRLLALTVTLLLAASGSSSAITLMVNGDTPSVRYQRWVDAMPIPTPNEPWALYLDTADAVAAQCDGRAGGCITYATRTIWITTVDRVGPIEPADLRATIEHEVGHAIVERYDDQQKAALSQLLLERRPWRAEPNSPHERAAEAVALCSTPRRTLERDFFYPTNRAPFGFYQSGSYDLRLTRRQLTAVCAFLRSAS